MAQPSTISTAAPVFVFVVLLWCRALMESWVRGGSRAFLELKETREPEDSREHQDPLDSR